MPHMSGGLDPTDRDGSAGDLLLSPMPKALMTKIRGPVYSPAWSSSAFGQSKNLLRQLANGFPEMKGKSLSNKRVVVRPLIGFGS